MYSLIAPSASASERRAESIAAADLAAADLDPGDSNGPGADRDLSAGGWGRREMAGAGAGADADADADADAVADADADADADAGKKSDAIFIPAQTLKPQTGAGDLYAECVCTAPLVLEYHYCSSTLLLDK